MSATPDEILKEMQAYKKAIEAARKEINRSATPPKADQAKATFVGFTKVAKGFEKGVKKTLERKDFKAAKREFHQGLEEAEHALSVPDFDPDLSFEDVARLFKNVEKNIDKIQKLLARENPKFCSENPDKDISEFRLLLKHAQEDIARDSTQIKKSLPDKFRRTEWDHFCTNISKKLEKFANKLDMWFKSLKTSKAEKVQKIADLNKKKGSFLGKARQEAEKLQKAKTKISESADKLPPYLRPQRKEK